MRMQNIGFEMGSARFGIGAACAVIALSAAQTVLAQATIETLQSTTPVTGERFGSAVASAPLFNTIPAQRDWVIVGVPNAAVGGNAQAGNVEFHPPAGTGYSAFTITAPGGNVQANAHFGFSLATGDVNGDGVNDVVVGAPDYDNGSGTNQRIDEGRAFVFFGPWTPAANPPYAGWCRMHPIERNLAVEPGAQFGYSVATGSLNGTSADVVIGIPGATFFNQTTLVRETNAGDVDVYLNLAPNGGAPSLTRDQHITPTASANPRTGDRLGHAVAIGRFAVGVGISSGSNWNDIAASAPFADRPIAGGAFSADAGLVNFYYGEDIAGAPRWGTLNATYFQTHFAPFTVLSGTGADNQNYGSSIDAGDHDADNWTDLAVGAPSTNAALKPYAAVLRGANTGIFTNTIPPDVMQIPAAYWITNNLFGSQVRWIQRDNSSTVLDLAVSMVTTKSGIPGQLDKVFIYDGSVAPLSLWSLLLTISDTVITAADAKYGAAMCRSNRAAQGFDEIVIGAPQSDYLGGANVGRVEIR